MIRSALGRRISASGSVLVAATVAGVLVSALALGVNARAAEKEGMSADAKALAKLDDEWSAAAATRDARRVALFYAEDAIAYPPNEPMAVGRAAAEKVWAAYFSDPTYRLSWKTTHAEVSGHLGYTTGTYEDSFTGPDGKTVNGKGKYSCIWKKQNDGTWKAIHDMWNTDTK